MSKQFLPKISTVSSHLVLAATLLAGPVFAGSSSERDDENGEPSYASASPKPARENATEINQQVDAQVSNLMDDVSRLDVFLKEDEDLLRKFKELESTVANQALLLHKYAKGLTADTPVTTIGKYVDESKKSVDDGAAWFALLNTFEAFTGETPKTSGELVKWLGHKGAENITHFQARVDELIIMIADDRRVFEEQICSAEQRINALLHPVASQALSASEYDEEEPDIQEVVEQRLNDLEERLEWTYKNLEEDEDLFRKFKEFESTMATQAQWLYNHAQAIPEDTTVDPIPQYLNKVEATEKNRATWTVLLDTFKTFSAGISKTSGGLVEWLGMMGTEKVAHFQGRVNSLVHSIDYSNHALKNDISLVTKEINKLLILRTNVLNWRRGLEEDEDLLFGYEKHNSASPGRMATQAQWLCEYAQTFPADTPVAAIGRYVNRCEESEENKDARAIWLNTFEIFAKAPKTSDGLVEWLGRKKGTEEIDHFQALADDLTIMITDDKRIFEEQISSAEQEIDKILKLRDDLHRRERELNKVREFLRPFKALGGAMAIQAQELHKYAQTLLAGTPVATIGELNESGEPEENRAAWALWLNTFETFTSAPKTSGELARWLGQKGTGNIAHFQDLVNDFLARIEGEKQRAEEHFFQGRRRIEDHFSNPAELVPDGNASGEEDWQYGDAVGDRSTEAAFNLAAAGQSGNDAVDTPTPAPLSVNATSKSQTQVEGLPPEEDAVSVPKVEAHKPNDTEAGPSAATTTVAVVEPEKHELSNAEAQQYLDNYPDLQKVYGKLPEDKKLAKLKAHYLTHGHGEGRHFIRILTDDETK